MQDGVIPAGTEATGGPDVGTAGTEFQHDRKVLHHERFPDQSAVSKNILPKAFCGYVNLEGFKERSVETELRLRHAGMVSCI